MPRESKLTFLLTRMPDYYSSSFPNLCAFAGDNPIPHFVPFAFFAANSPNPKIPLAKGIP